VSDAMPGVTDHKYVAIYEMDTDDPDAAVQALIGRLPTVKMTDAFDAKGARVTLMSQCSEEVHSV
jgi:hypothetical protein